jgi:hypothetical protein
MSLTDHALDSMPAGWDGEPAWPTFLLEPAAAGTACPDFAVGTEGASFRLQERPLVDSRSRGGIIDFASTIAG